MDIARLGLAVDSSQVEKGTVSLHQLTGAAGQASVAAQRLAGATTAEAAAQQTATAATLAHNAALNAQHVVMRSTAQQRTMMIYQLNDVAVSLASGMNPAMVAMQQGSQILQGGFAPALRTIGDVTVGLVTKFWPLAAVIGVVSAAIAGMTNEINETSDVTVSFGDTALATWQVIAGGIYEVIRPAVEMLGGWFGTAWDWVVRATKDAGNWIIRSIVGSIEYVKTAISTLPATFVVAGQAAAQGLADAVAGGINAIIGNINSLSASINQLAGRQVLGEIGGVDFGQIDFGGDAAMQSYEESWGQFNNTKAALGERDFMGEFFGAISGQAQELALARQEVDALGESAGTTSTNLKAANDNIWGMTDALRELGPASVDPLTMLRTQMTDLDGLLAQGKISWEEYGEAAFRANSGAASSVLGLASGMTGALAKMFQDNKAFAIANAVVSTAESVMKALATYGPTPWGFAAAGVAAATGAAQIAAIMSASPGGGSSGSVRAPAGAATQQNGQQRQQAERAPDRMDITLHGLDLSAMYSGDNIERLLGLIEERSADGRILNIKVAG